jgi:hypothetical protein
VVVDIACQNVSHRQPHRQIIHRMDIGSGGKQRPDGIGMAVFSSLIKNICRYYSKDKSMSLLP